MTYAVKECFLTPARGEGVQSGGARCSFAFAGCNLWSGRELDRATARCNFCDTDFVGTDEPGGRGKFAKAEMLGMSSEKLWGRGPDGRLVVITGGEPRPC